MIDSLQIIFFQIFAFVLSCDVVRVACLSKQASECSFITLTGNFLFHIGENTLQYFFYPYCYVHLSLEHHPTLVSSYQTRIFTAPKLGSVAEANYLVKHFPKHLYCCFGQGS